MTNPKSGVVLSDIPVRTIDREELQQKLARGDRIRLVNSLREWSFRAKHIPGSIHFDTEDEMLANLQKGDDIVVYCTNPACLASIAAYHRLLDQGYTNVRRYSGGLEDWENAGLPLEGELVRKS
jgi:rhodanese-related sulfurtransferase